MIISVMMASIVISYGLRSGLNLFVPHAADRNFSYCGGQCGSQTSRTNLWGGKRSFTGIIVTRQTYVLVMRGSQQRLYATSAIRLMVQPRKSWDYHQISHFLRMKLNSLSNRNHMASIKSTMRSQPRFTLVFKVPQKVQMDDIQNSLNKSYDSIHLWNWMGTGNPERISG